MPASTPTTGTPASRKAVETPTVAVHNVVEQVLMTQGRRQQIVHVIATNAYVKTPAGWKMVLHHAAPAPEGKAEDIGGYYRPDVAKASAAMRPSTTFNGALAAL